MTRTSSNAIEVAIVGGGIAGLAAAAFLRKYPQYNITIFERRREDDEEHSSGLALRDGGKAIMKKLGITREEVGASPGAGYRTYTINEDLLAESRLPEGSDGDSPMWLLSRGDLKDALFRRATSEDGKGKPAKIVYNSHIVRVDPDTGTIHFANATSIHADLIIGADGIHSKVRSAIIPESHPQPAPCGISLYRFMLPMETFENAVKAGDHTPVMFQFNEDESFILMVAATDGSNCTLCCYPCEGHKTMNVACGIFDSSAQTPEELEYSWQAKGKKEELKAIYHMFPEWFTRVLDQVPEVALFQIRDQDPLPIYFKHQTVLIGDAAHAILPLGAQGANQALEDAEGLDALLADVTDVNKISDRLALWDSIRRPRAAATQRTARGFESVLSSKANQDKVLASKPFVEMRVLAGM